MLINFLANELEYEKKVLARLKSHKIPEPGATLTSSRGFFYLKRSGEKKRKYIPRSNTALLWKVTSARFLKQKIKILENNISQIEKFLKNVRDYDDEHILASLPKVYADAAKLIRERKSPGNAVIQSENNYKREELTIKVSNGLLVRTREELIIAELLISLGICFRYEKAVVLEDYVTLEDGRIITKEVTVYPDFTIVFADGTEFYWEHCGRLDDADYRKRFNKKLKLYTENGIFAPARLLITTSGKGEAINMPVLRDIVMKMIMPYC